VDQVHVIRHKVLVEGRPIRAVAREMGVSRNTVRKYLQESEPVRKAGKAKPRPVTEVVRPRIEALLEAWRDRTTPKQRITGSRLHEELVGGGARVGVTTVREILREIRRQQAEVFVPLVHRPGDAAQVDFFEVTVEVAGERRKAWKFVMRLMHSGRDFAWLYERCDQVAFLDGHVRAFAHFGVVPHRCVYDNLSPAVRKVVFPKRELTARFQALVSHYLFEPCFARPGEGHDKGGVEARGKAIRLQHLTPIPRANSLAEIAQALLTALDRQAQARCDREGKTVLERFEVERRVMLPLPQVAFDARKVVPCSVSRRSLVRVEGATYSVPSPWQGLEATAYVGPETVEIVCREERERYARERFGGKAVRYRHYLGELSRKPQALRQVAPELLAELGEPFAGLWRLLVDRHGPADAARVFARILEAIGAHGEAAVAQAVATSLAAGTLHTLPIASESAPAASVEVPVPLRGIVVETTPATAFDALLAETSDE
jgi:transposase